MSSWCTSLAIPKSVTLHFSPSPTRTFLAAKSRWIIYMTKTFYKGFFKNRIKIKIIFFSKLCLGPPHMSPVSMISLIYLKLQCVHMGGWAGSVPQISRAVFPKRILETGLKFHIWTQGEIGPGNRAVTTDRRQFTLFYLFYFPFFWYFICMSAFWFAVPVTW